MAQPTRFTELGIERFKAPKNRENFKTEGGGLYLRITPKGKKVWLHYSKNRKWFKLGEWQKGAESPYLSLTAAREANDKIKRITDKGLNPFENDLPDTNPTVREFYDRWFNEAADKNSNPWSPQYKQNVGYIFETDILPYIGGVKVRDVAKSNVAHIVQKVIDRKANSHARQVYLRLKRFFNYAAELDIIESSPMATMPIKGTSNSKDRALKVEEIKVLLNNIYNLDMAKESAKVLELILRTGQRPTECAGIHKDEIEGNWWTLLGDRTKNGLTHRVYLTDATLALLGDEGPGGYFFGHLVEDSESKELKGQPMHRNTLAKALRRSLTGKEKTQKDKTPTLSIDPFTPHDLRRTCATHMAEIGFTDDVIGAVLNHKKRSVTRIYNRHQYDKEKMKALIAWGQKLATITGEKPAAKVINIAGGTK